MTSHWVRVFSIAVTLTLTCVSSFQSKAVDIIVNFTPYNCFFTPPYDTTVQFVPNDRLIIINGAPGSSPSQYFVEINEILVDTIFSSYGDTMWNSIIDGADTMLSFHVLALPGMCYGQRFHLQTTNQLFEMEFPVFWSVNDRRLVFGETSSYCMVIISDLAGKQLYAAKLPPAKQTAIELRRNYCGLLVLAFHMQGKSFTKKVIVW